MKTTVRLDPKQRYLVAVSGGCDSMALLDMLVKEHYQIVVAHVNYRFRPTSNLEEQLVRTYCHSHQVSLFVRRPKGVTGNKEQWARQQRYQFFAQVCKKNNCAAVLTAHQLDDSIETYLMAQQRHSAGWYFGIVPQVNLNGLTVIRPLLKWRKTETRDYCLTNEVPFHDDESNAQDDYQRNRIRHQLVQPADDQQIAQWENEIESLNQKRAEIYRHFQTAYGQTNRISLSDLRNEAQPELLLRWFLWQQRPGLVWSQAFIIQNTKLLQETKRNGFIQLDEGYELVYEYGQLYVNKKQADYRYVLNEPKKLTTPFFSLTNKGEVIEGVTLQPQDYPLTIRNWKAGDQIKLRLGTKAVARFLVDRKIPHAKRAVWPVVENKNGEVIFVAGIGCDPAHYSGQPNLFLHRAK